MRFKVGDRVIHNDNKLIIKDWVSAQAYHCDIYDVSALDNPPAFRRRLVIEKPSGNCAIIEVRRGFLFLEKELECDYQWYREQKINSLLK